jgi:hypothetical protein
MKEASWKDCVAKNSARRISPDMERAESLIETARERTALIKDVNEKNCNFVFEDYYTSLLELLQAMAFMSGYNVLNHVCLGYYLRDVMKRDDLRIAFDDLRYKRNSLTYYGSRMDFETAKRAIDRCRVLAGEIENGLRRI